MVESLSYMWSIALFLLLFEVVNTEHKLLIRVNDMGEVIKKHTNLVSKK